MMCAGELSEYANQPTVNFIVVCTWLVVFVTLFHWFTNAIVARSVVKPRIGASMALYLWQQEQDEV